MTKDARMELLENFDKYRIGLDDVFAFKCRACGKCCKNREDILLNARDVYNIATALNVTVKQAIETYCEVYIGGTSRIPIVRLKPKGVNNVCPLLKGGKCSVHSLKPCICAMFPIGRAIMAENEDETDCAENGTVAKVEDGKNVEANACIDNLPFAPNKIEYVLNPTDCASSRRKQTVRAWLEMFGIPVEDEFFLKWNETIISLSRTMQRYEGNRNITANTLNMVWDAVFTALYVAYDAQKDFYPQFTENAEKLLQLFEMMKQFEPTDPTEPREELV